MNSFENLCYSLKQSNVKLSNFEELKNIKGNRSKIIDEEKPNPIIFNSKNEILWKGSQFYERSNENINDFEDEEENEILITIDSEENKIQYNEEKKKKKKKMKI